MFYSVGSVEFEFALLLSNIAIIKFSFRGCPKRASSRTFRQPADPILNMGRRCRIGVRHDEIDNISVKPRPFWTASYDVLRA